MFNWFASSRDREVGVKSEQVGLTSAVGLIDSRLSSSSETLAAFRRITPGSVTSQEEARLIVSQLGDHEERRDLEDEQEKSLHKQKVPLEEDSYGLLIMRILFWTDGTESAVFWTHHGVDYEGSFRQQPSLAVAHALLVFILTVVTQIVVTFLLYRNSKFLIERWTDFPTRTGLTINAASNEVSKAVASGALDPTLLSECAETWAIRDNQVFPFILILWTAKMVPEFKMAKKSLRELWSMDAKHGEEPMLAADGATVLRITSFLRAFLMLSIPVVRLGVTACLFIAGCDFICAQENVGSVVIKGMCMFFVTDIDSIFLKAFASEGAQKRLKSFRMMVRRETNVLGAEAHASWDHGLGGLFYMTIVLFAVGYQTGFLGIAREVPGLDHTKAQLYHFRIICHKFCSQGDSPCES